MLARQSILGLVNLDLVKTPKSHQLYVRILSDPRGTSEQASLQKSYNTENVYNTNIRRIRRARLKIGLL